MVDVVVLLYLLLPEKVDEGDVWNPRQSVKDDVDRVCCGVQR